MRHVHVDLAMEVKMPPHLEERCLVHNGPVADNPIFVVHWMRAALRLDENPTFDVARTVAKNLGLPLLIYQGIDERYPHASYRHHRFLLEGAADIAHRAKELGVNHVLHVARDGHRAPNLLNLSKEAAIIVTDLVDLPPWSEWTKSLARVCTVIEVDAHCVLPRTVFGRSCDRPFQFRDATKKEMKRRMARPWPVCNHEIIPVPDTWAPPFTPVDASSEINKDGARGLLAACNIDPSVVPVTDMIGGASVAIARWNAYLNESLSRYHRTRNNAAERNGVSGISPWLHHGMIAATRIVRDAANSGSKGAIKFLDEMLVFREHAYHHVHDIARPSSWEQLPDWARSSWENSAPTRAPLVRMELERGRTGDILWDAAQTGLVRHGVMHNNVRMTWGKGTVQWLEDPEEAMRFTQDLNDRYALDGRDPNSIAGVMWCFGLFDRAFDPPETRMGRVRRRDSSTHLERLDIEKYRSWTLASAGERKLSIGIIGGGLSGRFSARLLSDLGHEVIIYDKGQRASGRFSDRRARDGTPFQLGALKLEGWPNWAAPHVQDWIDRGFLKSDGKTPETTLPPLLEYLGEGIDILQLHHVDNIMPEPKGAHLLISSPHGPITVYHDHVIVAIPFEQSSSLLKNSDIKLSGRSESCWVAWGPYSNGLIEPPEGWDISRKGHDKQTVEVRINSTIGNEDWERSLPDMAIHVATTLGIKPEGWVSHHWRFSRPIEGPERVIHHGPISVIGDAFGTPIGTAGAALDSAARAVADLHCRVGWHPCIVERNTRQTNFSEWDD